MIGKVFNIQRFSLHDGPGIRTTCFLMGCSLRCRWCHNPEGLFSEKLLQFHEKDCIGCGACQAVCPKGVHQVDRDGHHVAYENCSHCGRCLEICPTGGLSFSGKEYSAQELAEICGRDKLAYKEKGGVTFSGGEPLLQAEFVAETARLCKQLGIPTVTVDTAGNVEWAAFEKVLPWTDFFLFDIKAGSEKTHILGTGVSNKRILENLKRLDAVGKSIYIRIPVIGGVNDTEEEMEGISAVLKEMQNVAEVRLLPYHTFGREKYRMLGMPEPELFTIPDDERMGRLKAIVIENSKRFIKEEKSSNML